MMTDGPDPGIIKDFWLETHLQIRYMRKNIVVYLLLTMMIVLMGLTNTAVMFVVGQSMQMTEKILFLIPHPIFFIIMAIFAGVQIYALRSLKALMSRISRIDSGFSHPRPDVQVAADDDSDPDDDDEFVAQESMTDINYEMINLMTISLRVWPIISVFFAVFMIGNMVSVLSFPTHYLDMVPNSLYILDMAVIIMVTILYYVQTRDWIMQRRRLKMIEFMERTIAEELNM